MNEEANNILSGVVMLGIFAILFLVMP